jgi:uroporphyrinogen decarboxylase
MALPKEDTSVDSRTRVINTLERRPVDRIPRSDGFWEDTLAAWRSQGLPADKTPADLFGFDLVSMSLDLSMRQEERVLQRDDEYITVQDRFGYTVRTLVGKSRTLHCYDHATRDREAWERLKPRFTLNPDDAARIDDKSYFLHLDPYPTWAEAKRKYDALRATQKYLLFTGYGPWEGTWRHRGYTELMMDTATDPDWVRDMGETLIDLLISCLEHCLRLDMRPDGLYLVDDLAFNQGLLFSPTMWRSVFKPGYRKLGRFLHANGISFWLHCCGNCEALLDDLIECGLQVLQPLQAKSGMDVRQLKPKYGQQLTFFGNIDVHKMEGPAEALEAEIRDKISMAKVGGGYIYHSDHSIPPEITLERYRYIMELVERYGDQGGGQPGR